MVLLSLLLSLVSNLYYTELFPLLNARQYQLVPITFLLSVNTATKQQTRICNKYVLSFLNFCLFLLVRAFVNVSVPSNSQYVFRVTLL